MPYAEARQVRLATPSLSAPMNPQSPQILAKDKEGRFHLWNPPGQQWSDGSAQSDLPMQRLSEIFNVNNFIVSQVNPHVVPALKAKKLFA